MKRMGDVWTEEAVLEALGFCGCGQPEQALRYVRDGMRLLAEDPPKGVPFHAWWPGHEVRLDAFAPSAARDVLWYLLNDRGLAEHGGSIPGWLTEKGEEVLAALEGLVDG